MDKRFEQMELLLKQIAEEMQEASASEYGVHQIYSKLATFGLSKDDIEFRDEDEQYLSELFGYDFDKIKIEADELYPKKSLTKKIKFRMKDREQEITNLDKIDSLMTDGKVKYGDKWIALTHFKRVEKSYRNECVCMKDESFLYIRNEEVNKNFDTFTSKSSIKLYIPLGKKGITKILELLLFQLSEHGLNIKHDSKISAEIRTDDFVIRVNTMEEAESIVNYLNSDNEYIDIDVPKYKDLLIEPNPFVMRRNNIGFASDRYLSYNANVADYINQYMQDLKSKGRLPEASREGFEEFVISKYSLMFKDGKYQEQYENNEFEKSRYDSLEKWLMNKMEIFDMLLIALNPESTMETFYQHWNDINDVEYNQKLEEYFINLVQGIKTEMPLKPSQLRRKEEAREILELIRKKSELLEKTEQAKVVAQTYEKQLADELAQDKD